MSVDTGNFYGQHIKWRAKGIRVANVLPVVAKATPALNRNQILLAVEVKKKRWARVRRFQLHRYMEMVDKKCSIHINGN